MRVTHRIVGNFEIAKQQGTVSLPSSRTYMLLGRRGTWMPHEPPVSSVRTCWGISEELQLLHFRPALATSRPGCFHRSRYVFWDQEIQHLCLFSSSSLHLFIDLFQLLAHSLFPCRLYLYFFLFLKKKWHLETSLFINLEEGGSRIFKLGSMILEQNGWQGSALWGIGSNHDLSVVWRHLNLCSVLVLST